jgi:DNA repair exonuclease SbcCD ATPase subunit
MAKITFVLEDGQEVVVPLTERVTIGRSEDNDVLVDDERISLQHAELLQNADGSIQVFDLNSESGTFVNGVRQKSCTLLHGDQLAFGPLTGRLDLEDLEAPAVTPEKNSRDDQAHAEEMARMEAEKARLQAAVDDAAKELRDWEKRAETERALHLARIESLRAEEAQLAPVQAAVREAEAAHRDWLEAVSVLSTEHQDKSAALERLNAQHVEKTAEVKRLTAEAATATREVEALTARLKQVRDECEQDEALLNSLRQQIIKLEVNVKEEEARQAALAASGAELVKKRQKDESAVKDLESLLMKQEQQGAAAEVLLQRRQEELAACEKKLAAQKDALEAENRRLEQATARRAEIERQSEELADVTRQLADARHRAAQDADAVSVPQLAAPKRKSSKESAVKSDELETKHQALMRQIESARLELGELQGKITALRETPVSLPKIPAEAENAAAQLAIVSPPVIVQVEPLKLAPVSMKSERAKASAGVSGPKSPNA